LDGEKLTFKFDIKLMKFYKVVHASLDPDDEDVASHPTIKPFPTFTVGSLLMGYPKGYNNGTNDMKKHMNQHISESTMKELNIEVGQTKGALRVNEAHERSLEFNVFIHVIPFKELFCFIFYQDGSLYAVAEPPIWQGLAHATPKFKNSS
jgi:hypothetical protein